MLDDVLLDGRSFVTGFVAGAIIVSILARMFTGALHNWDESKKASKGVSVRVEDKVSARQIVQKSAAAGACFTFWLLAIGFALVVIVIALYRIWNV